MQPKATLEFTHKSDLSALIDSIHPEAKPGNSRSVIACPNIRDDRDVVPVAIKRRTHWQSCETNQYANLELDKWPDPERNSSPRAHPRPVQKVN